MFRTVPLSIIRSFSLYAQQWYMSYSLRAASGRNRFRPDPARKLSAKPVWHIPLLCVQWKTPDDGHRNCPKHVEFYSKNKFEKLVHLFGFVIRIYHDARSAERQTGSVYRWVVETELYQLLLCILNSVRWFIWQIYLCCQGGGQV